MTLTISENPTPENRRVGKVVDGVPVPAYRAELSHFLDLARGQLAPAAGYARLERYPGLLEESGDLHRVVGRKINGMELLGRAAARSRNRARIAIRLPSFFVENNMPRISRIASAVSLALVLITALFWGLGIRSFERRAIK